MKKGILIVLSGPSGVGKGTIIREVLNSDSNCIFSISATTRKARKGEVDGVNYHFFSTCEFHKLIPNKQLLEHAVVYGNYYGTMKEKTLEMINKGFDVILEIDTVGGMNIKKSFNDALTIFLLPPDIEALYQRLKGRGTETQEIIDRRHACVESELAAAESYDYQIINNNVSQCANEVINIIKKVKENRIC